MKNTASENTLPIPAVLEGCFHEYLKMWKPNSLGLLFRNRDGRAYTSQKVVEYRVSAPTVARCLKDPAPGSMLCGTPTSITYLLVVAALLAWSELTVGKMRLLIRIMVFSAAAIALAAIGWFYFTGSADKLLPYNNFAAVCAVLVLATLVAVPKLSTRFLVFPSRILTASTLVFALEGLYVSVSGVLHFRQAPSWRPCGGCFRTRCSSRADRGDDQGGDAIEGSSYIMRKAKTNGWHPGQPFERTR